MSPMTTTGRRRGRPVVLGAALAATLALTGACSNSKDNGLPGAANNGDGKKAYDSIITGSPVADASAIQPGSWADKIKQRGYLRVGGTDAGPLFSIKDPVTGRLTGFDAGLSQMLAHYITGGKDIPK